MSRLDRELVARALVRSRSHAAELIAAGRVLVDGNVAHKASFPVNPESDLAITGGHVRYVGRGAQKLVGALEAFPSVSVSGKRCLDAGASTGGFTQVLLERGAREVVAVDVGHGQLAPSVAQDPRVCVYEGCNVRFLAAEEIGGAVECLVADLSFISLTLVLPALYRVLMPGADAIVLVKPQFEVGRGSCLDAGVVTDSRARRDAVERVRQCAAELGFTALGSAPSSLRGQRGNEEYFLWLARGN